MDDLASALLDAGGARAPRERAAQLRTLLAAELAHGRGELALARSGRERPVARGVRRGRPDLLAVTPAPAALRADPRGRRGAHVAARRGGGRARSWSSLPRRSCAPEISTATWCSRCEGPATDEDAELAALAFDEQVAGRRPAARACARAARTRRSRGRSSELREPIGATHPLRVAEAVARLGGRPADPASSDEHEEAVLAMLAGDGAGRRAPARRPRSCKARCTPRAAAARRDGQVGRLPHRVRAPRARLPRQRPRAGRGGRRGAPGGGPARREAVGRPAPRVPELAPRRRHPQAHRRRRRAVRTFASRSLALRWPCPDSARSSSRCGRWLRAGIAKPARPDRLVRGPAGRCARGARRPPPATE